jgi:hypothetical protein
VKILEDGGGEFAGALLGQKVSAAFDRAALYMVAESRDRRLQGVAGAVPPPSASTSIGSRWAACTLA